MSLEGFTAFLLSTDNSAFSDQHGKVYHDMTRPLSEYYISSSHNTYLVGHQLVGVSTVEGYIRALLHSCRSVEREFSFPSLNSLFPWFWVFKKIILADKKCIVDVYDGDSEPMIFHGKTFTSKVSLREVCLAISKYAFVSSPYPVIISAEIHCGLVQQDMLARIMKEIFEDALVCATVEEVGPGAGGLGGLGGGGGKKKIEALPSPEELKGKVLLKVSSFFFFLSSFGRWLTFLDH
jgi:phosphatidylinositol phospholipase C, delta